MLIRENKKRVCGGFTWRLAAIVGMTSVCAWAEKTASFAELARRAEEGGRLQVTFLGGSLTWGANASDPQKSSYRGYMMQWLNERFPKASFIFNDAAIGGTGSNLAIFRLQRDVLATKPDLVFLDFTVNDDIYQDDETHNATYESLLRRLIREGVPVMQVLLGVRDNVDPQRPLANARRRPCHLRLHEAYRTGCADVIPYVRERIVASKVDLAAYYPFEGTHPDDNGYRLFFECVRDGLERAMKEQVVCALPEKPVYSDRFERSVRVELPKLSELPEGWRVAHTLRTSAWFDGLSSRWMDQALVFDAAQKTVTTLRLTFEGELIGLFGEGKPDALDFIVSIDGKRVNGKKECDWKSSPIPSGNLFFWRLFADSLPPGKHLLEITPVIPASRKGELRLGFVGYAGRAATSE